MFLLICNKIIVFASIIFGVKGKVSDCYVIVMLYINRYIFSSFYVECTSFHSFPKIKLQNMPNNFYDNPRISELMFGALGYLQIQICYRGI